MVLSGADHRSLEPGPTEPSASSAFAMLSVQVVPFCPRVVGATADVRVGGFSIQRMDFDVKVVPLWVTSCVMRGVDPAAWE